MDYDPTQPLPDSDLIVVDLTQNDDAPTSDTVAEKKQRRRFSFGDDYMSVIAREPGKPEASTFYLSDLKENTIAYAHAAAFGVSVLLGRSDDMLEEFMRILSGKAAERKVSVAKPKVPNFWRQAIALTFVDVSKKAPNGQMTLEAATAKANGLERSVLMRLKGDPAVIKHHNKLTGATQGYSVKALFEAEAGTV
jgi:hypothetical protein